MVMGVLMSLCLAGAASAASAPASAAKDSIRRQAAREGWPDTPAAEKGRGWVEAFSTGEQAMRAFLSNEMAPKSLEGRNVKQRVENYRTLRERYGKLVLGSVEKSTPAELTAKLMASDGSSHTFIFTVQPEPPHKLVSVGIRERSHGGGHGFGH
jgi:hypothetical protein